MRQHIVDRLGGFGVARQPGALGTHPVFESGGNRSALPPSGRQAVIGRHAIVGRSTANSSSICRTASTASGAFLRSASSKIGQLEELAPAMTPASRFGDRPRLAPAV